MKHFRPEGTKNESDEASVALRASPEHAWLGLLDGLRTGKHRKQSTAARFLWITGREPYELAGAPDKPSSSTQSYQKGPKCPDNNEAFTICVMQPQVA